MAEYDIYGDIAQRTGGEIYIGVVGPVRTGKSTFITRFMEELVIPSMSVKKRGVAVDEMPQSASGKTVMTTEPKFIPSDAVSVKVGKAGAKIRLIDCVGYMVKGALGSEEDGKPRLVSTPWADEPMAFEKAAEFGTEKVIKDHSTIGIVVTGDGSFTDLERGDFVAAEDRVIEELKSLNKPFIVIFNTTTPGDEKVLKACRKIEEKHGVTVLATDVLHLDKKGIETVLEKVLEEFPLRIFDLDLPAWIKALPLESAVVKETLSLVDEAMKKADKMKCVKDIEEIFSSSNIFEPDLEMEVDMGEGRVRMTASLKRDVFYRALGETSGEEIGDEGALMEYVATLSEAKKEYSRLKTALSVAREEGYGVVCPVLEDSVVSEPEIIKKGGQYSVRLKVDSKSLHLVRADLTTNVDAVSGSKKQCEDFVDMMTKEGFDVKVFGRPLSEIVAGEMDRKSDALPSTLKAKLKRTVTRAVNEKKTGLICILL